MRNFILVCLVLVALFTPIAVALATAPASSQVVTTPLPAAPTSDSSLSPCCFDGSPCCGLGLPCCEGGDCCFDGSPCCFDGSPCCAPACCEVAASCCKAGASCCK